MMDDHSTDTNTDQDTTDQDNKLFNTLCQKNLASQTQNRHGPFIVYPEM